MLDVPALEVEAVTIRKKAFAEGERVGEARGEALGTVWAIIETARDFEVSDDVIIRMLAEKMGWRAERATKVLKEYDRTGNILVDVADS